MPTPEKEAIVEEVAEKLNEAKSVFLTDFRGLNVREANRLRRSFSDASVQYRVVKNTLARLSVKSAGCDELLEYLDGPTAMAFAMDDPSAPAKVIKEFSKESDKLTVKACLFEGVLIGTDKVGELANMPSRIELLGMLTGVLEAPLSNFVFSLNAILNKLAYALDAVRSQKEQE